MDRVLRPVSPTESQAAQQRLKGQVLHSPIVKLQWRRKIGGGGAGPEIYLKLENLQAINSFKIRGAMNAVLRRKEESAGQARMEDVTVVTCSAGNMGQAVSYAAKVLNCRASVVIAPDSAPKNKVDKMRHETFGFDEARQVHDVVTSQSPGESVFGSLQSGKFWFYNWEGMGCNSNSTDISLAGRAFHKCVYKSCPCGDLSPCRSLILDHFQS